MCRECVREALPERGRVCLDAGAYLVNWAGCAACGAKDTPVATSRQVEEDEEEEDDDDEQQQQQQEEEDEGLAGQRAFEEVTTYKHVCAKCDHFVCEHYHRFATATASQEFLMSCVLCGRGSEEKMLAEEPSHPVLGSNAQAAAAGLEENAKARDEDRPAPAQVTAGLAARISTLDIQAKDADQDDDHDEWED